MGNFTSRAHLLVQCAALLGVVTAKLKGVKNTWQPSNRLAPLPPSLQPPHGPLHDKHAAALQRLGLGLEHNLQDGPLSKQVCNCSCSRSSCSACWLCSPCTISHARPIAE